MSSAAWPLATNAAAARPPVTLVSSRRHPATHQPLSGCRSLLTRKADAAKSGAASMMNAPRGIPGTPKVSSFKRPWRPIHAICAGLLRHCGRLGAARFLAGQCRLASNTLRKPRIGITDFDAARLTTVLSFELLQPPQHRRQESRHAISLAGPRGVIRRAPQRRDARRTGSVDGDHQTKQESTSLRFVGRSACPRVRPRDEGTAHGASGHYVSTVADFDMDVQSAGNPAVKW